MSNSLTTEDGTRIALEDIIAAAGRGAQRALSARQLAAATSTGFYIDCHIRCGIPPVTMAALSAEQAASESKTA
jgi:hypothetical protein